MQAVRITSGELVDPAAAGGVRGVKLAGQLAAVWGVGGVVLLCGSAVFRLGPLAWEPIQSGGLSWWHWALYAISIAFNGYAEGYKAFQKAFAPRVVSRAMHLARNPTWLHGLLAPAFCMALFHATRRRMLVSRLVVLAIVLVVIVIRLTPQPWRGIIDAGVVVGLGWGVGAIVVLAVRVLLGHPIASEPELPEPGPATTRVSSA